MKYEWFEIKRLFPKTQEEDWICVDESYWKHKTSKIGEKCNIGKDTIIGPNVTIGSGSILKENVLIKENVFIGEGCRIEKLVIIHENVKIGECTSISFYSSIGSGAIIEDNENDINIYDWVDILPNAHFKNSPTFIMGSIYPVCHVGQGMLQIGCNTHSLKYWLENYSQIGKDYYFSEKQIAEYKRYIDLIDIIDKEVFPS